MGFYINETQLGSLGTSFQMKCENLEKAGAMRIPTPTKFQEGLICVVDNGFFGAAGYAYSESEMNVFKTSDGRFKSWYYWKDAEKYAK